MASCSFLLGDLKCETNAEGPCVVISSNHDNRLRVGSRLESWNLAARGEKGNKNNRSDQVKLSALSEAGTALYRKMSRARWYRKMRHKIFIKCWLKCWSKVHLNVHMKNHINVHVNISLHVQINISLYFHLIMHYHVNIYLNVKLNAHIQPNGHLIII